MARERLRKLCVGKRVKFNVVRPGQNGMYDQADVQMQVRRAGGVSRKASRGRFHTFGSGGG